MGTQNRACPATEFAAGKPYGTRRRKSRDAAPCCDRISAGAADASRAPGQQRRGRARDPFCAAINRRSAMRSSCSRTTRRGARGLAQRFADSPARGAHTAARVALGIGNVSPAAESATSRESFICGAGLSASSLRSPGCSEAFRDSSGSANCCGSAACNPVSDVSSPRILVRRDSRVHRASRASTSHSIHSSTNCRSSLRRFDARFKRESSYDSIAGSEHVDKYSDERHTDPMTPPMLLTSKSKREGRWRRR
jgi:hypothetical protein